MFQEENPNEKKEIAAGNYVCCAASGIYHSVVSLVYPAEQKPDGGEEQDIRRGFGAPDVRTD